jgi:uncharacterized membrane protein
MHVSKPIQRAAMTAASAMALATLAIAVPAQAAPVFTDAQTDLDPFSSAYSYAYVGPNDCGYVSVGGTEPTVPVVENGPAASASTSASGTYTNTSIPGDTGTGTSSASGTGKVTSVGGDLSTMDLSVTSAAQVTNAVGSSTECIREMDAGVDLEFEFTVTHPGFLTLTTKNTGSAYGDAYIYSYDPLNTTDSEPYADISGNGLKFNATTKVYLPAGTYRGDLDGESYKYSKSSYSVAGTSTMHATFNVAGSQTEAVSGKGKKYVTLPSAWSCATHSINASVIGKKKRADQIKQVNVFVNDAKVKKVKTPDKGDAITIPVADDQTADVRAEVTLFPRQKGKPGKVVQVTASYEACS